MRITHSVKVNTGGFTDVAASVRRAAERGMNDVVDDLIRTSSDTTPLDKGILQKSWSRDVHWEGDEIVGEVGYRAVEGDFDYAIWTHEADYNLGPESQRKSGGTGMSGTHYPVGNKYLTRPLEGEAQAYRDHIGKEIRKELG